MGVDMEQRIKVADRWIGHGEPVFIIAEAGSNHDRDMGQAKKMIDAAISAGVDAVKFQLFKAEDLRASRDAVFDIIKKCEFPREWLGEIMDYCRRQGIIFMATPFDREAVALLDKVGMPAFKIASSEIANPDLLRGVAATKKPIILSTGMSDLADVHDAMDIIRQAGGRELVLLHCLAMYPTPPEKLNLKVMDTLRHACGIPVGFSDHTLGILLPSIAVARGACVIEKHFTLDRTLPGPDHSYAIEPKELLQMVRDIRTVEASLGSPDKIFSLEERAQTRRVSLFTARDIACGKVLAMEDIVIHSPATGLPVRFLSSIVGKTLRIPVQKDQPVRWDMI